MTLDGNCEINISTDIEKVTKNWKQVWKRVMTCLFDFAVAAPENCGFRSVMNSSATVVMNVKERSNCYG